MLKILILVVIIIFVQKASDSKTKFLNEFSNLPAGSKISEISVSDTNGCVYVISKNESVEVNGQPETVFRKKYSEEKWESYSKFATDLSQTAKSKLTNVLSIRAGNNEIVFVGGVNEVRRIINSRWSTEDFSEMGLPQTKDFKVKCLNKYSNNNVLFVLIGLVSPPDSNGIENGILSTHFGDPDYGTLFKTQVNNNNNVRWLPMTKDFQFGRFDLPVVDVAVSQVNPNVIFVVVNNNDANATFNGNPKDKSALNQNNNLWLSNNGGLTFEKVFNDKTLSDADFCLGELETAKKIVPHLKNVEIFGVGFDEKTADTSWAKNEEVREKVFLSWATQPDGNETRSSEINTGIFYVEMIHFKKFLPKISITSMFKSKAIYSTDKQAFNNSIVDFKLMKINENGVPGFRFFVLEKGSGIFETKKFYKVSEPLPESFEFMPVAEAEAIEILQGIIFAGGKEIFFKQVQN